MTDKDLNISPKILEGTSRLEFKFDNGYGASIVKDTYRVTELYSGKMMHGVLQTSYEVAVLDSNAKITYDTPITSEVLPGLSWSEVEEVLEKIKQLN